MGKGGSRGGGGVLEFGVRRIRGRGKARVRLQSCCRKKGGSKGKAREVQKIQDGKGREGSSTKKEGGEGRVPPFL